MATKSSTKMYISWTIAGIVILALLITVFIQNGRINAMMSVENNVSQQEDVEKYKTQIDELESQIADMQAWQDYLEDTLNENKLVSIPAQQNRPAANRMADTEASNANTPALRNNLRSFMSSRYDALAEEIGFSEETKSKLMDLFSEMQLEIMDMLPRRGGPPEMMDRENIQKQIEKINSKYNEKLSELLSPNELDAFKEYQSSEQERRLIMGFNNIFEDDLSLDKEKEKELVTAMYNARQTNPGTKREDDSVTFLGRPIGPPQMDGGVENMEKLNSTYIESARDILSEDEMKKFEEYINTSQPGFNMRRGFRGNRFPGSE